MNKNIDRLYELLPAIYRMRDAEQGEPLKALLRVISEQVNLIEDDIGQLYDNWFIETCEDWVVPYIGDLVGYRPIHEAGEPGDVKTVESRARNKILIPRREVANTIRYRRRKGTLALLELLANDVAGWPARAVKYDKLLSCTQSLNHQRLERGRTIDVRCGNDLEFLDGPFDNLAHTVDLRRINSHHQQGRYNIPSVGLYVWRLKPYQVTQGRAHRIKDNCYTFSALGNDAPIFLKQVPETDPTHIADEFNLPVPMRRRLLHDHSDKLYGENKSFFIWKGVLRDKKIVLEPVTDKIIAADLSDWYYIPRIGTIAVDPVLGRIATPEQKPTRSKKPHRESLWVSYYYGFSADMGGGEYERKLSQPEETIFYRVCRGGALETLNKAFEQWQSDNKPHAVIEIADNREYIEPVHIEFTGKHESLQLRAAVGSRPVIRPEGEEEEPDSMTIIGPSKSRFTLDGIVIAGTKLQLGGDLEKVTIRHSTLVPGWKLHHNCKAVREEESSLEIFSPNVCVVIERSILGTIQVDPTIPAQNDELGEEETMSDEDARYAKCHGIGPGYRLDPIRLCISDSILDAVEENGEAIGAPGCPVAHAVLTIRRCTVFGQIHVRSIELGENCIFNDRITVARRQYGCLRFCYVTPDSRTPSRYNCQPESAEQIKKEELYQIAKENMQPDPSQDDVIAAQLLERERIRPQFNSIHYGTPTYCQLAENCAEEIKRGADDESEMGVFHDLFQPQREANLRTRLDEYIPAGADVGVILAS
jgi:hypothetical protein